MTMRRTKPKTWHRALLALGTLALLWLAGFGWFAVTLPVAPAWSSLPPQDAVVVLTGSRGRIDAGLAALEAGVADRLLISGADPALAPEVIESAILANAERAACCIELGQVALNTEGNAAEVIAWADTHGYRRIALITADWHMRRSLVEFRRRGHGLTITPIPVGSQVGLPRLALEYSKYLIARLRAIFA